VSVLTSFLQAWVLGAVAVACVTLNVVGGFLITDRTSMLFGDAKGSFGKLVTTMKAL
jgi:NAD/NADP transhydrogenase alpha subunit